MRVLAHRHGAAVIGDLVRKQSMAQPHEVLGVAANADKATINAAFRRAAKKFHPDLNNGDSAGIQRLRRLIAARDILTSRKWHLSSGPSADYQLPASQKTGISKSVALTFALTAVCAFLLLPAFVSDAEETPLNVSIVQKTGLSQKTAILRIEGSAPADAEVLDAGSAEIKVIRDLQEAPGFSHAEADAVDPLSQNGAKRAANSPAASLRKAVKGAATLMSKTFQRIASEL